ncbi:lipoprotein [Bordetella genomosp. 9]|uniref:Lipoprotein n=2 Tax=Bordetella genomosp. 9 TaxID=1416803 RepID=A0A261RAE9_9BORD|nr:FixH family protein [Bordetella genomosp. 9]OZI21353.1 lipoprotein [Bordetella genomosp. 9]
MDRATDNAAAPARPWYREPWPWILMAGPAVALVGCMVTMYLAANRYVDAPITEGATRQGLVVTKTPAAIAKAPAAR